MSEREKPFTVSDRRHFTPEGQARDGAEDATAPAPAAGTGSTQEDRPQAEPRSEAPPKAADGRGAEERSTAAGEQARSSTPRPAGPVDFSQFLLSLGAQAAALLSGADGDKESDRASSLEAARSVIGILEMLRDKTEARRTPEEERLLEGLLFELRMAFVERSRQA